MNEIDPRIPKVIDQIFHLEDVDDCILGALAPGGVPLIDGRILVPLNVYLKRVPQGEVLGIQVAEVVHSKDRFGGA